MKLLYRVMFAVARPIARVPRWVAELLDGFFRPY